MPYVNGKYTNPGWSNDTDPPIDADNLNDISNALQVVTSAKAGGGGKTQPII